MSTFCSLPFVHLATHPHGGVTLCCVSDFTNAKNSSRNFNNGSPQYLNLNNNTVEDVMNSDYFKGVRLQMLNNEQPEACRRCYLEETAGIRSKRIEENERLQFTEDIARATTSEAGAIPVNFKFVELRLGNLCNVKCRTCNPSSSTSWSSEYMKLQKEITFVTQYDKSINSSWTENDEFWDDLLAHCDDLQLLYINGGEPTLVEKHWKFLQKLIDRGLHRQVTLWYNINMTNLPDKLIAIWKQFKAVQVSCSIDDLGKRNEYIRTGTKWHDVVNNLNKLQSLPWIHVSVCQTVSWLNVMYLNEFHEFMAKRNLSVYMNFVHDPKFLSIRILPKTCVSKVLPCSNTLPQHQIDAIISNLAVEENASQWDNGVKYNAWLDSSRNTSLRTTFSRIFEIIPNE